jgi:hypothetical protein
MLIESVPALAPTGNDIDEIEKEALKYIGESQGTKHITRIHIYDERATGNSQSKFYQQIIENGGIANIAGGSVQADGENKEGDEVIFKKSESVGTDNKKIDTVIPTGITAKELKELIKDYFPCVTVGTNNSTVKSISFQSSTSGDVNNVLLLNSLGNSKVSTPGGSDLIDQQEVKVIPSTITISCLGLPVVQRGNQIYIDTGTGTTLDNIYTVTSVSHSIGAGDFSTSLTLTCTNQGDTDALRDKIIKALNVTK